MSQTTTPLQEAEIHAQFVNVENVQEHQKKAEAWLEGRHPNQGEQVKQEILQGLDEIQENIDDHFDFGPACGDESSVEDSFEFSKSRYSTNRQEFEDFGKHFTSGRHDLSHLFGDSAVSYYHDRYFETCSDPASQDPQYRKLRDERIEGLNLRRDRVTDTIRNGFGAMVETEHRFVFKFAAGAGQARAQTLLNEPQSCAEGENCTQPDFNFVPMRLFLGYQYALIGEQIPAVMRGSGPVLGLWTTYMSGRDEELNSQRVTLEPSVGWKQNFRLFPRSENYLKQHSIYIQGDAKLVPAFNWMNFGRGVLLEGSRQEFGLMFGGGAELGWSSRVHRRISLGLFLRYDEEVMLTGDQALLDLNPVIRQGSMGAILDVDF